MFILLFWIDNIYKEFVYFLLYCPCGLEVTRANVTPHKNKQGLVFSAKNESLFVFMHLKARRHALCLVANFYAAPVA